MDTRKCRSIRLQYCIGAALTVLPLTCWAQSIVSEQEQKSIDSLPKTTVTATRTTTPADLLPVTAHSVTRRNIEEQPTQQRNNYGELLMDLPGVFVAPHAQTVAPWVNLRGTGYFISRTLYLVDGLPVNSSHIPMLTNTVAPTDIEQLDVVLGPSSALYGASAAGGVMNIITRNGLTFQGKQASMSYGSFNTTRASAAIGDRVGDFDYYFSATHDRSDGYKSRPLENMMKLYHAGKKSAIRSASIEDEWSRSLRVSGAVGLKLGSGRLSISHHHMKSSVSSGQPNRIGTDKGTQSLSTLKYVFSPTSNLTLTGTLGYQYRNRPIKRNGGLRIVAGKVVLNPNPTRTTISKMSRRLAEVQADYSPWENHFFTLGLAFHREKLSSHSIRPKTGKTSRISRTNTDEIAAFLQYQGYFLDDRLSVILGGRYDKWRYFDNFDSASNPSAHPGFSRSTLTWRGAAKYKLNDHYAIRSSLGTAFWPGDPFWFFYNNKSGSTWREANPNLKPEKTWMVDFGLEASYPEYGLKFGVTPYYGRIKNMLSYRYDQHPTLSGVQIIRTSNMGKTKIYGVEGNVNWQINPKFALTSSLTLNRSRIIAGPKNVGNQVSNAPNTMWNIGMRYTNPNLFNAQVNLRSVSQRYYDNENTQLPYYKMRPYKSLNAKIWKTWKIGNGYTLTTSLSGVNLLNQKHENQFTSMNPGRTWMATLSIKGL